jgi:peptidoglycan/LPS O-acetylase OafA/YrhL
MVRTTNGTITERYPSNISEAKNAWRAFLLIQNYFPMDQQFMAWTWSLSVEVQFYVTFPLFLWVLMKLPSKLRIPFQLVWLLGSFVVAGIVLVNCGIATICGPFH